MQNSSHTPSHIKYMKTEEFQPCAGNGCDKLGTNSLKIIYINKTGWFCDDCKEHLLKLELVFLEVKN